MTLSVLEGIVTVGIIILIRNSVIFATYTMHSKLKDNHFGKKYSVPKMFRDMYGKARHEAQFPRIFCQPLKGRGVP